VVRLLIVSLAFSELLLGLLDLLQILFERLLERRQPVLLPEVELSELLPGRLAFQERPLLTDSLHPQSPLSLLRLIDEVLRGLVAVVRHHAVLEIVWLVCIVSRHLRGRRPSRWLFSELRAAWLYRWL
jgi:hypothetical protein